MEGIITSFDRVSGQGVIRGEDEKEYMFQLVDWNDEKMPAKDQQVSFEPEEHVAKAIALKGSDTFTLQSQPAQQQPAEQPAPAQVKRDSGLAIASMVCGIVGIFGPTSLVAVILGHLALSDIRKNDHLGGEGFAKAGLILGYVMIALSILLISFIFVGPFMMALATHMH